MSPLLSQYNQWVAGRQIGPALPRPAMDFLNGAFGPLQPLVPMPIDEPLESGRPEPRRWQYPVGWNIPIGQPGTEGLKMASFPALRRYADLYSVVRAMLNIRKDEVAGTEWDIGATPEVAASIKGQRDAGQDIKDRSRKMVRWFKRPDPEYYSFASWLSSLLEERFVIDALSLYLHPTRVEGKGPFGSNVAALELLNGETIRPLVDMRGSTPRPPDPAYQQYLWGVPRSDLMSVLTDRDIDQMEDRLREEGIDLDAEPEQEYRADQLWYLPRHKRVWTPYGFSEIEMAIVPITLGLNRQSFLLDWFTEGTIPGVYVIAGDSYATPTQQRVLQDSLNAIAGDIAWKHRVIVLPPGSKTEAQKDLTWAKDIDQNIIEQVMMILHIQPHEVGMVPGGRTSGLGGKGMAEEQAAAIQKTRTIPELLWLKSNLLDPVIQDLFHQRDLEWKWLGFEEEEDESQKTDSETKFISIGKLTIDEARIEDGLDPFNLPLTSSPIVVSGGTVTPLDPQVKAPPPPPAPAAAIGGMNPNDPAGQALAHAGLPTKADSNKPKVNPLANLTSPKKGKRKKARNELVDRFAAHLKDQSDAIGDAQKEREKNLPDGATNDKGGKKDKVTVITAPHTERVAVGDLVKWRIKYNDAKLDGDKGVVATYLRRSYPEDVVKWAGNAKWSYEPKVKLDAIDFGRRPGGRDPKKVASIADSLGQGASMDPVVLIDPENGDKLVPADGWHRLLGAEKAGWDEVPAFVGKGVDGDLDTIEGPMQDASDSKKKVAHAELAVLRRFLRKGGKVENFRTAAIDRDVMRLLPAKIEKIGADRAIEWAHGWVDKAGGNPQALRDWYNEGADGQIDWGSPGDFMACVGIASKYMDEEDAKGFCNERHQDAVGGAPGTEKIVKYSPDQPRDEAGRWSGGDLSGDQPVRRYEPVGVHGGPHAGRTGRVAGFDVGTTLLVQLDGVGAADRPLVHIERGDLHRREAPKTISLGSPLTTGLVPFDLAGQAPARCRLCGRTLVNGICPEHGPDDGGAGGTPAIPKTDLPGGDGGGLTKYDASEERDWKGRWSSEIEADAPAPKSVVIWHIGRAQAGLGGHDLVRSRGRGIGSVLADWEMDHPDRQVYRWRDGTPPAANKYSADEPRDASGRWSSDGGGATAVLDAPTGAIEAMRAGRIASITASDVRGVMTQAMTLPKEPGIRMEELRVDGKRPFGDQGLGIPRSAMPQAPEASRPALFAQLRADNIPVTHEEFNVRALHPTQDEISLQRTAEIWHLMQGREDPSKTDLLVSKDNYVIDGHHRWAAGVALSFDQPGLTEGGYRIGMDAQPLLNLLEQFDQAHGIAHRQMAANPTITKLLADIDAELARRGVVLGKAEDGSFFTDETGVHPIRNAPDYSPTIAGEGRGEGKPLAERYRIHQGRAPGEAKPEFGHLPGGQAGREFAGQFGGAHGATTQAFAQQLGVPNDPLAPAFPGAQTLSTASGVPPAPGQQTAGLAAGEPGKPGGPLDPNFKAPEPPPAGAGRDPNVVASVSKDLSSSSPSDLIEHGGGVNAVYKADMGSTEAMLKPEDELAGKMRDGIPGGSDIGREMAAQAINQALGGLVDMPVSVVRTDIPDFPGQKVLVQEWRDGTTIANSDQRWGDLNPDQIHSMALFDGIIGNTDRHGGNAMVDNSGNLIAIDHGLSFPNPKGVEWGDGNFRAGETAQSLGVDTLTSSDKTMLQGLLDQQATLSTTLRSDGVRGGALSAMWDRVNYMLKSGEIVVNPYAYGSGA